MDFEAINKKAGGCGIYQYIVFVLLSSSTFKMAVDFQGLTFALHRTNYTCVAPSFDSTTVKNIANNNKTLYSQPHPIFSDDHCRYKMAPNQTWKKCKKWIYDTSKMTKTLINEFDLICDKNYYKDLLFIIFFLGAIISCPLSIMVDRIGRKWMLLSCVYVSVVVSLWEAFALTMWQQFVAILLAGISKSVYVGLAFTTMLELMPFDKIELAANNFWLFYALGYMATAGFAYYSRSWRVIQLFSLTLSGLYIAYIWFIPETPRWLMLNGKRDQAYKVFTFISRINRTKLSKIDFNQWHPIEEKPGRFWQLFQSFTMVSRLMILTYAAMAFSFAYVGSSTDLTFASNNIFLTTFIMGAIELPTGPLAALISKKLSRKMAINSLSGIGIVCLALMPAVQSQISTMKVNNNTFQWQPWLLVCLAMGSKLGFTSAWCVFDLIINELIPTTMRNAGMTVIYIVVGAGAIISPIIHEMAKDWHYSAPCVIYSILLILTVVLVIIFLPETKGIPLPQTLDQALSLKKGKENQWKADLVLDAKRRGTVDLTEL